MYAEDDTTNLIELYHICKHEFKAPMWFFKAIVNQRAKYTLNNFS